MMRCPDCKQDLVGKKVKDRDRWMSWMAGSGLLLATGPWSLGAAVYVGGTKLFKKHVMKEVDVKCPWCGAKLTVTKEEFKELKEEYRKIQEAERIKGQKRVIK